MLRRRLRSPRIETELEFGCLLPAMLMLAVAIATGVLLATRLQPGPEAPREVVVRVIDDGAKPGPKVVTTQIVPLR